jgi:eukaryotic-like serine/threonine-protein kinase
VLYEMLTGQLPFMADTPLALMLKQVQEAPRSPRTLNPTLPESIERILLKALAPLPAGQGVGPGLCDGYGGPIALVCL